MLLTYDEAMTKGVFPIEGGYTNDPRDPGGPTNFGITLVDARKYWKANATAADVKAMPKSAAETIYALHYAAPVRYNDLPAGLDYSVLDYGINSGIGRAGKVLRRLVGLADTTSTVTDEVIAAVRKRDPKALINAMWDERLRFLKSLKTWPAFGAGWNRRCVEGSALALHLASALPVVAAPSIAPTPTDDVQAKAVVPLPKPIKAAIDNKATTAKVTTAGGAGIGVMVRDWIAAHPGEAVLICITGVVIIGAGVALIERAHKSKQEAATPGILPVPAAA